LEFGEHIGSLMDLIENLKGTDWEPGKNEKNSFTSSPKFKRKKSKAFSTQTDTPVISWGYLFIQKDFTRLVTLFQGTCKAPSIFNPVCI
jgi:hypothetical protein